MKKFLLALVLGWLVTYTGLDNKFHTVQCDEYRMDYPYLNLYHRYPHMEPIWFMSIEMRLLHGTPIPDGRS